jgi:hypothetical protein
LKAPPVALRVERIDIDVTRFLDLSAQAPGDNDPGLLGVDPAPLPRD